MTIHVIGNATLDITYRAATLPRPGETLLAHGRSEEPGGKGLNQALAAARASANVAFTAAVGDDRAADSIRRALASEPTLTTRLLTAPYPTDESAILVGDDGENAIVTTCASAAWLTADRLGPAIDGFAAGDTILVQGNLTPITTHACLDAARRKGLRLMVNPAPLFPGALDIVRGADVIIVNQIEAATLTHASGNNDPGIQAETLSRATGADIVLTLGSRGCIIQPADSAAIWLPAPMVSAADTAGAGDAFAGWLAAGLSQGMSMAESAARAVAAAALTVMVPGTSTAFPRIRDVDAFVANDNGKTVH